MELKPGYKLTDIGILPDDWDVTTVGDQFSIQLGKMIDAEKNFGILKPYLGNSDVQWGRIITDQIGTVRLTSSDLTRFLLQEGDLLVCEGGEVGRAAIWRSQLQECYFQKALHRLRPLRGFNVPLMQNLLLHLSYRGKFANYVTQTSIAHLPKDKFLTIPIPLPPVLEQNAIAEALSDVDGLIESLERLISKKRQIKQGTLQELITGKSRLPGFSDRWIAKPFAEIARVAKSVVDPRTLTQTTPCIEMENLDQGSGRLLNYTDATAQVSLKVQFIKDDVLFGKLRPYLRKYLYAEFDGVCSSEIWVLRPVGSNIARFVYYVVQSEAFNEVVNLTTGTKMPRAEWSIVKAREFPIPPTPEEQEAISKVLASVDAEMDSLESKLAKTRRIKQGMMQELLTGRIRFAQHKPNVVQFCADEEVVTTPKKGHNSAINEAVIISVLAKKFGSENYPLGRKRYTKLSYLFHRHAEGRTEGYLEKAAGPYNPSTKYKGAEKIALSNRYVRSHARDNFSGFVAAEKIAEAEGYFAKWYGNDSVSWLEQFRYKKNDELELLATVDMAVVKLRETGKQVSVASVKLYLHDAPEWKAKLGRSTFADENIDVAIKWSEQLFKS